MSQVFTSGRVAELVFLVACFIVTIYALRLTKKGWLPFIRRIPALDAIDEAVGRAVEMGRPIHVAPGVGGDLDDQALVGFEIIRYTAQKCAESGAEVIATVPGTVQLPIVEDLVRNAYITAGAREAYKPENVRFLGGGGYAMAVQGIIERERCVGNISVGQTGGQIMLVFARAKIVLKDVINIGGTSKILNISHMIITCDYLIMGEEMYAVSAYLTREPSQLATIRMQDVFKVVILLLLVVGILVTAAGSNIVSQILKM